MNEWTSTNDDFDVTNDFQNALDLRARDILADRIGNAGALIVWPDERRAYLDDAADVPAAAAALGVEADEDVVNTALWEAFEAAMEQAAAVIAEETMEREDINDGSMREHWLHTWTAKDGWYFCFSGINRDGLYSESEDDGPYPSRADALAAAHHALVDAQKE